MRNVTHTPSTPAGDTSFEMRSRITLDRGKNYDRPRRHSVELAPKPMQAPPLAKLVGDPAQAGRGPETIGDEGTTPAVSVLL